MIAATARRPFEAARFLRKKANGVRLLVAVGAALLATSDSRWGANGALAAVAFPIGVGLVGLAFAGRTWALVYHSGRKNRTLLTEGPYSVCRNPIYFCNVLGGVGAALTTATLSLPLLTALGLGLLYGTVIRREEANLRRLHGEAFDAYCRATPAFLPAWSRLREPESWSVAVREVRIRMLHGATPLLAVAAIDAIRSLHVHHVLPALFSLP